jgi:D-sedoheptulose 7-phosphate isomerase
VKVIILEWEDYVDEMKHAINIFSFDKEIIRVLKESRLKKQRIFIAGNGGSAAASMNLAADFNKCAVKDWKNNMDRYNATTLCGEISHITAISNDDDYSEIFKQQLINHSKIGDIVILISDSGNSKNVIKAAEWANQNGLITVGFTGFDGGQLKSLCKYSAHVQVPDYGVCEDVHNIFGHYLTKILREAYDEQN